MAIHKENSDSILNHARDDQVYNAIAGAAVTPGEVITATGLHSDGNYPEVSPGASTVFRIAREYSHTGMTIDDAYSSGDHLEYYIGLPGDRYRAFVAAGENVSYDDDLVLDASGHFTVFDGAGGDVPGDVVAKAREEVDNSAGAEAVRLNVMVK